MSHRKGLLNEDLKQKQAEYADDNTEIPPVPLKLAAKNTDKKLVLVEKDLQEFC